MRIAGNSRTIVTGIYWSAMLTGYLATAYMPWRLGPNTIRSDALIYRTMSEQLHTPQTNPLGLRLPVPYLVHFLSIYGNLDINSAWRIVTIGFTFATLLVYFLIFAKITEAVSLSCMLTAMVAATYWLCVFSMQRMCLLDPAQNFFLVLVIWAALRRNFIAFVILLALGAMFREPVLLAAPTLLLVLVANKSPKRMLIRGSIATFGAIAVYFIYRAVAIASLLPGGTFYIGRTGTSSIVKTVTSALAAFQSRIPIGTALAFGILPLIVIFGLTHSNFPQKEKRTILGLIIGYTPIVLFARIFATDAERVLMLLAPVVFIAFALIVANMPERNDLRRFSLLIFTVLYAGAQATTSHRLGIILNFVALILFGGVMLVLQEISRRQAGRSSRPDDEVMDSNVLPVQLTAGVGARGGASL
ncbi:hypothetical protein [Mycobacterium haemophilum]|uniref:hypothetical protein n=1 Tax=Mycobacterium haemophilum TaxID=29311 RepID=UPI0012E39376|nr:hypothetical protein [Mycobacterium haemophilum]MCV7339319.1 hypothetical protein [Mycobacterium haemophilum DSM 44634]